MRKHTTLDLDQGLVREAAVALGTSRITETVHAALAEVVARRRRAVLARLDFPDLTPGALAAMRAPRRFDTPVEKPAVPAEQPAVPAEQPAVPAEQPAVPVEEPAVPAEEPAPRISRAR